MSAASNEQDTPPQRNGRAPRPLVLIVEDDTSVARLIARFLTRAGYAVMVAASGEDALERARALPPAVITLDLVLPRLSGAETLAALRADVRTRDIPVIVVSVRGDEAEFEALPVFATLTKPLDREALLRAVAAAIASRPSGAQP